MRQRLPSQRQARHYTDNLRFLRKSFSLIRNGICQAKHQIEALGGIVGPQEIALGVDIVDFGKEREGPAVDVFGTERDTEAWRQGLGHLVEECRGIEVVFSVHRRDEERAERKEPFVLVVDVGVEMCGEIGRIENDDIVGDIVFERVLASECERYHLVVHKGEVGSEEKFVEVNIVGLKDIVQGIIVAETVEDGVLPEIVVDR